ncbi:MAG: AAA family ATPase [Nakamurella sp.]
MSVFSEFCAAGLWPGVNASFAQTLEEAGVDRPEKVTVQAIAALSSVTDKRAGRLYSAWLAAAPMYELTTLLLPQRLPIRWVRRLADQLGDAAATLLAADPWRLLTLPDATVAQADAFARSIQPDVHPKDPRRLCALLARILYAESRSGHTVSPLSLIAAELARHQLGSQADVEAAVTAGVATAVVRRVMGADNSADQWVALENLAAAEESVAHHLLRLERMSQPIATAKAAQAAAAGLDDTQRGAVVTVAEHGVSVLTGGPGTGKSRTVTAVVRLAHSVGAEVVVAAPTGRAAKRLTELLMAAQRADTESSGNDASTDDGNDGMEPVQAAVTIHRLLGARPPAGGQGSTFEYDESNPIEADVVVVDETSMLDVELAAALLSAIPDGSHLLLVGDPAQLPSIGAGSVLGDILAAVAANVVTITVTELTTLYRQAAGGAIARLAAAVRIGELIAPESNGHEVMVVPSADSADASRRVIQLVTDSIPRVFGLSPDQIQVVTPVHRGPAGTKDLNTALKKALNPGPHLGKTVRGFDVGDRVVATANHFDAEPTGYANGEIGTVIETSPKSVLVAFPGGEAEIAGKSLGDLLHGWAITVHRAQGSEWDAVVAVFPPEAGRMLSRPLIYTALTRARIHLSAVHAAGPALAHAVRRVGARPRRTRLAAILAEDNVIHSERHSQ